MKICTPDAAVACIAPDQRVYVHEASMVPHTLLEALVARAPGLSNVELVHLRTDGAAPVRRRASCPASRPEPAW